MEVKSPIATYWQVGTLSNFTGTQWLPDQGTESALSGSSSTAISQTGRTSLLEPAPTKTFEASVSIEDFASRLLPAPPHATGVSGLAGAEVLGEEGVLARTSTGPGTTYSVTAAVSSGLSTAGSSGGKSAQDTANLAPYLELPLQPEIVTELAHEAVGSATTPAAEAQALVDWFRSGQFKYTLDPPPTPGPDPVVEFLTETRAGYCQQFAGAYGVLARTLGLPTRLVVGFTSGSPGPNGTYLITGSDAHVWPQVYLGPDQGWVSVEPTPSTSATGAVPEGVVEPQLTVGSGDGTSAGAGSPSSSVSQTTPGSTSGVGGHTRDGRSLSQGGRVHRRQSSSTSDLWWWIGGWIFTAGLVVTGMVGAVLHRRRRTGGRSGGPADDDVVRAWELAQRSARRVGLEHRRAETPAEYATRILERRSEVLTEVRSDGLMETAEVVLALADLAGLVERACYAPGMCSTSEVDQADVLAHRVVVTVRRCRRQLRQRRSHRVRRPLHDSQT
jgi:transglutaminase-like putative cysteine protease